MEAKSTLAEKAQRKIDMKTKPQGSLGILEAAAVKLCSIQKTLEPSMNKKYMLIFAADHGIAEEGVSAFPQEVTAQMVDNFQNNGAAINVLCRRYDINLKVIDVGVKSDLQYSENIIDKKVAYGTKNFTKGSAMTYEEALQSITHGRKAFTDLQTEGRVDVLGLGEMGIGNTSSATAIIAKLTGLPLESITGRGTGLDDAGLHHKIAVLQKALNFHKDLKQEGLSLLQGFGGFEIGAIAGAALEAAEHNTAIMLDGVISTTGGMLASLINPAVKDFLFIAHKSVEPAHLAACEFLGIAPLMDLNLRLGEGSGAALGIDVLGAACDIMNTMASFDDAGVSTAL